MGVIFLSIAGILSGILSGMGMGGGIILIPILTVFLNVPQHMAQGINLLYFIPTAVVAIFMHLKSNKIDVKVAIKVGSFGVLGSIIGGFVSGYIPSNYLKNIFGVFIIVLGIFQLKKICKKNS